MVLADINDQTPGAATDELTASGHRALAVSCDVSDEEQVAALVERTVDTFGRLDFAFNNAGIQVPPTDAADEPAETFDHVNAINLRGVWACMKHELGQMREAVAPSSTAPRSGPGCWAGPPITPSTASSASPRARRWNTPPRDPHQRDLPGDDRDADGRRHARQGRARHGRSHRQPANRTPRPSQRDRRGRALALQPGASFVIGVALPVDGGYTAR